MADVTPWDKCFCSISGFVTFRHVMFKTSVAPQIFRASSVIVRLTAMELQAHSAVNEKPKR